MKTREKLKARKVWKMPEWMEPYRGSFKNTGGNTIEELMDAYLNTDNLMSSNMVLGTLAIATASQIALLEQLHEDGQLTA